MSPYLAVLLAVPGWLVVALLPGALLVDAVRPGGGLRNWTLAVPASFGVLMLAAEAFQGLGLPVRSWTVLPVALVIPAAVWSIARGRPTRADVDLTGQRVDLACVASAAAIGLALWLFAMRTAVGVLPNSDGAVHALLAKRILDFGTLNGAVFANDPGVDRVGSHYYPLAIHVAAAQISAVTGAPVGVVLTVGMVLAAAVLLPLGTLVLTRQLCPSSPHAGRVAAVLSVLLPWFPYAQVTWGGLPFIVGMSQVPGAVAALLYRGRGERPVAVGAIFGIAAYGLFQEHTSELVTVGMYSVILGAVRFRKMRERRELVTAWLVGLGVFLALAAFLVRQFLSTARGVSGALVTGIGPLVGGTPTKLIPGSTLGSVLSPLVLCLAFFGCAFAVRERQFRGWGWCWLATIILFVASVSRIPFLFRLTTPWYEGGYRLAALFSFFETTYGAFAIAQIALALGWVLRRTRARQIAGAAAAAMIALVAVAQWPSATHLARAAYLHDSLVGPDQRAAFSWLARHVPRGGRVLNQFGDGSSWMEILDGVTPVFAVLPRRTAGDPRIYLLTHALGIAHDPRTRKVAAQLEVRYVYVNEPHFDGMPPNILTAAKLAAAGGYRLAWSRGGSAIFEITAPL